MPRTPPPLNKPVTRAPLGRGMTRAIFAVTGVVDDVQDLILPGAFTRTLATRRVKSVWHHDWKDPVGTVLEVEEWRPGDPRFASLPDGAVWPSDAGALVATVRFNMRTSRGRDAYEQVKDWHDHGEAQFSIGYKVTPGGASKRHDGVRIIHDLELYEISPVLHGAHPLTRSLEVKAVAGTAGIDLEHKAIWSAVALKAAETNAGRGAMIALSLPPEVAAKIAHPEGTTPENLHITLAYLGDAAALGGHPDDLRDIVTPAISEASPIKGSIGGIGRFPDRGDGEPAWVPVDVPGLAELRQRVVEVLGTSIYSEQLDDSHGYTPHITLGYDLPDIEPVGPIPVTFDQIHVVRGEDDWFVPLGQTKADATTPAPPASAPAPAPVESKSAAQIVLEAKSAHRTVERKSAAQIVLEAKSAAPIPETAPMRPMPLSYEQLHARLTDSVRQLWKSDDKKIDCWVCVEATYPDHVIATRHEDGSSSTYSIPYVVAGRDIDLGTPTEVELTTVALPVGGASHPVGGDEETVARYVQPTAAVLDDATALIEVSGAGPDHLQHLQPKITQLLATLAKKGLPMDKHTGSAAPAGSSLDLWDSDFEITDGWDDEDESALGGDPVPPGNTSQQGDGRAMPSGVPREGGPESEASPYEGDPMTDDEDTDGQVRLDADEVKSALAALTL
ncbi:2'-5' RNA ligase family protein [Streptomyces sp. BV286]|uniref:2'-5' RNA ligase family protein n=1 Tax=Streptomyces sp. BV286 TaxID=2849672 RepID=UPI001C2DF17F|nr:2'-5' RNA ligase family protein [Streptomyces sp. BV286]MBV1940757.1 2'-5' RNA ligase family protein [Streptomyces sp. BV286]